jgi:hypothetical protein
MARRVRVTEHTVDDEVRAERIETDRIPGVAPDVTSQSGGDK